MTIQPLNQPMLLFLLRLLLSFGLWNVYPLAEIPGIGQVIENDEFGNVF